MIDPAAPTVVVEIECISSFSPGGNPADQLADECLGETTRRFRKGMRTPGQATVGLKPDPSYPSHVRLYELSESDDPTEQEVHFVLGWSDGTGIPPTVAAGEFVLPATRTWFKFSGYVGDFPFDFATASLVESSVQIQRSGRGFWVVKTP